MRKIIQKILARILNSSYVSKNPFVENNFEIEYQKQIIKNIKQKEKKVTLGPRSRLYEETVIYNLKEDNSKIIIGSDTHIRGELLIKKYGGSIKIGDNSFVGSGTKIWSGESITIGDNVLISHNCNIVDTNSHEIDHLIRAKRSAEIFSTGHWEEKGEIVTKPIVISNNVWISFNVTILKGVTIGEGAIIAANSLITKDVTAFVIIAGNPAKIIKYLHE